MQFGIILTNLIMDNKATDKAGIKVKESIKRSHKLIILPETMGIFWIEPKLVNFGEVFA
jgi:hypothetical protein